METRHHEMELIARAFGYHPGSESACKCTGCLRGFEESWQEALHKASIALDNIEDLHIVLKIGS